MRTKHDFRCRYESTYEISVSEQNEQVRIFLIRTCITYS